MAWEQLNGPLGAQRADFQTANIALAVVNAHRTRKQAYRIWDVLPFKLFGVGPHKAQTPREMFNMLRAMFPK